MTDEQRFTTIDEYISTFPGEIQTVLEQVRQAIRHAVPEAVETISYGMPTFDLGGKHLVFFAGWKEHLSLYPLPAGDEAFQQELARYKRVKSTIQFPLDKPIPYEFVERIVTLLRSEKPEKERERRDDEDSPVSRWHDHRVRSVGEGTSAHPGGWRRTGSPFFPVTPLTASAS